MQLRVFQVDVFSAAPFSGNPAAVVLLEDDWLPDEVLQAVAAEHNLSETAFVAPAPTDGPGAATELGLRWFTPTTEVDLCGHGTLAAGHVVLRHVRPDLRAVPFATRRAGRLEVRRADGDRLTVALPLDPPRGPATPAVARAVADALGAAPVEVVEAAATIARFADAAQVEALRPDHRAVAALATPWVAATAPDGDGWCCRYFAAGSGIDEDPATGSAQTYLAPYWWPELGDRAAQGARVVQRSPRGGLLHVDVVPSPEGGQVLVTGDVAEYLAGTITFPVPGSVPGGPPDRRDG